MTVISIEVDLSPSLCPTFKLHTYSIWVSSMLCLQCGKVTKLSTLQKILIYLIFECGVEGRFCPTMQCKANLEEPFTAGGEKKQIVNSELQKKTCFEKNI